MNEEIKQIYTKDQEDRINDLPDDEIWENDLQRMARVSEILDGDTNLAGIDYHHAAMIFQHGEKTEHYKRARDLALKAVEMGDNTAKWLAAASLDRLLISEGKPQKYGTQFILNSEGEYKLSIPVDPNVTDEERALWNVPPLKDAQKIFDEKS